jgi:hypothetical protein
MLDGHEAMITPIRLKLHPPDWWYGYDPQFDRFLLPLVDVGGNVTNDELLERSLREYPNWNDLTSERMARWICTAVNRRLLEPAPDTVGVWD